MKVTSPWKRISLSMCLAAGWMIQPVSAEEIIPVPVPAAEPTFVAPAEGEPTPAVPVGEAETEAPAPIPVEEPQPLQAVELATPLAAPPSSRLSRVRITDESAKPSADEAVTPPQEEPAKADDSKVVTELVKERFPNGTIKVEREVAQDRDGNFVLHGVYRQYDERGNLICEGVHEQGEASGLWKRYYRGGEAALLASSPYREFHAPFTSQVTFVNGELHGKWTISDAKQRKISEIEFVNGARHGKAVWFYPNGTLLSQATYDHGRVHGDVMKWGPDASLLGKENYTHGRKLAPKVEFYDAEHKRSEIYYLHAPLVVKTPDNFHTATLATFEQRGQDEKFGSFRIWHNNGQLARQGEFRYNLPVGKATWYFSNGQKQMEGSYVDGKQDGTWTWWHANGLKQIAGDYQDGVPVGKWSWWKEDGKLAQRSDMSGAKVANIPAPTPEPDDAIRR
jgi:antitoxin component YwqK of YwqJK toxin-antitoxin module